MNNKLVFYAGYENKPHIESLSAESIKESLFKEQYSYALKMLNQFISVKSKKRISSQIQSQTDTDNNIFAFDGDRGTGKTSCMLSVAQFLSTPKTDEGKKELKKRYENLVNQEFFSMDLIDPSYFDDYHNILSIFVAKLYKEYTSYRKGRCQSNSPYDAICESKERDLVEKFSLTQRNLNCLLGEKACFEDTDDFSKLEKLAASVELKENIKALVNSFLGFVEKPDAMLLVTIDDLDLNARQGDQMSEEIRKYLVQDNILVLMAVKIEQLSLIKRKKFQDDFQNAHKDIDTELDNMVERYMVKFIPQSHRIYMPDFSYYMDAQIEIHTKDEKLTVFDEPVKQAVLSLIFWKTRYLFYNTPQKVSPIVPRNLRELGQILTMLAPLKNFRNGMEKENNYNKTLFKKYFFEDWAENNLGYADCKLINALLAEEEPSLVNKTALSILEGRFSVNFQAIMETSGAAKLELGYILDKKNMAYNISIGDVLSIIFLLERQTTGDKDIKFLFMLKAIYSMRLYEYYDERTETVELFRLGNYDSKIARRKDILSGLDSYDRLVAGRFFNPRIIPLMPTAIESPSRIDRKIDGGVLNDIIVEVCEQMIRYHDLDNQQKKILEDRVKLVEFFMLCSARRFDTRNERKSDFYNPEYRQSPQINYSESLSVQNIYFDLNAFLYNVIGPEKCYIRFVKGEEFFKLLEQTGIPSLSEEIHKAAMQSKVKGSSQVLESILSLRNAEIIQDLYSHLESKYGDYRGDDKTRLAHFFSALASFEIFTHDRAKGNTPFVITMKFAKPVAEFLSKTQILDDDNNDLFNCIYSLKKREKRNGPLFDIDVIMSRFKMNKKYGHVHIQRVLAAQLPIVFERKEGAFRAELEERLEKMPIKLAYYQIKELLEEFV